jgi:hypothetical protein
MSIYDVTGENGSSPAAAKPGGDGGSLMDEMLVEGSRPKGAGIAGKCHQAEQGVLYLAERYKALPRPQQVLVAVGFIILVAVVVFFASGDEEEIEELFEPAKKLGKVSGRFVAAKHAMTWTEARTFCTGNVDGIQLHGLASVHSFREQRQLVSACKDMDLSHSWIPHDPMTPKPHGCWIGLNDYSMEGGFTWTDGSAVDYVNWYSGEPNDYGGDAASTSGSYGPNGAGAGHTTYTQGEDHVSINFVTGHGGSWNDEANTGPCAHNENVVCGNYPVCQTTPGPPVSDADSSVVGCMLPLCWRTLFDPPQSGRFVAIAKQFGYFAADKECRDAGYQGLASIHSLEDLQDATQACEQLATTERGTGLPHGCWIGLNDHQAEGQFAWQDGTAVDFMNWGTGEPNSYKGSDEDGVAMDFRNTVSSGQGQTGGGALTGGAWADVHLQGQGGRVGAIKQLGTGQCWGCYGNYGNFPLCQVSRPVCDNDGSGPWTYNMVSTVTKGRFIALHRASSWTEAKQYCEREFEGLASIHTQGESRAVIQACRRIAGLVDGAPGGCWIGLHDSPSLGATPGQFEWTDNSPVNYVNWSPGEPNNWGIDTHVGHASSAGEEAVQVNMAHNHGGGWNDAHIDGIVGHRGNGANGAATGHSTSCFGCAGTYGMYAVCQTRAPDPSSWANSHYLPIGQQVSNVNSWLAPTAAERTTGVLSTTAFGGPGKFIIYPQAMTWEAARAKCRNGGAPNNLPGVLASIHTQAEQDEVVALCRRFAAKVDGQPSGCWIGFGDRTDESTFVWSDNTPIDYLGWNTNEPSNHRGGAARISGEDMVAVELRGTWEGKWNDAHTLGRAHGVEACGCFGCYGAMGNYPICMLPPPPPTPPPLGVPPPPPRVCTVADDAMRGCYGRADGSDRPNHQPCCEVPPAITGCASLTSAAPGEYAVVCCCTVLANSERLCRAQTQPSYSRWKLRALAPIQPRRGGPPLVSRAFPSCTRSILTEIYLCHACSCHEIEDGNARSGSTPNGRSLDQHHRADLHFIQQCPLCVCYWCHLQ